MVNLCSLKELLIKMIKKVETNFTYSGSCMSFRFPAQRHDAGERIGPEDKFTHYL